MSKTEHYQLQKPDESKTVEQEIRNLQPVLDMLDAILHALRDDVNNKASKDHKHKIAEIEDLQQQLSEKMAAKKTFSLADLTDVIGSAEAAIGYILVKTSEGWQAQSGASALGDHKHKIQDITNLSQTLSGLITAAKAGEIFADKDVVQLALQALADELSKKFDKTGGSTSGGITIDNGPFKISNGIIYVRDSPTREATIHGDGNIKGDRWGPQYLSNFIEERASVGIGQWWQDVTNQRSSGTNYVNNTGRPIAAILRGSGTGDRFCSIIINNYEVDRHYGWDGEARFSNTFAIIPPGATYRYEWRLTHTRTIAELRS